MLLRAVFLSPLLLGAGAQAADLAVKAPRLPVVTAPSWTGWYAGINAGGDWGRSNGDTTYSCNADAGCYSPIYATAINNLGDGQRFDTAGFTGGIQGGHNWQAGNWLFGLEADLDYFRSAGSRTSSVAAPTAGGGTLSLASSIGTDWLFTLRPRLGVVAGDWLFYGTGGLAVSQLNASWSFVHTNPLGVGPLTESASTSTLKAGWTVGGGVETMLRDRWTVGAEYLFVKFDGVTSSGVIGAPATPPFNNVFTHNADLSANIVRIRLNKLF